MSPDVRLSAAFDHPRILYDPNQAKMPLHLLTRNDGEVPLKIYGVDGGCGCRRIDQSGFPTVLSPGAMLSISVELSMPPKAESESFMIQFQTDQGVIGAPASLVILCRESLSPESLGCPTLVEDETWEFELIHRAISESDRPQVRSTLDIPAQLVAMQIGTHGGRVAIAPQFAYQDTKYRLTLKDKEIGLHKALLGLKGPDGRRVIELPVVWHRVEYLSSVPEEVFLGARPYRVFLRCPDERVELTRVLSAPKGIKAVVSSTREVTVMLGDDAPAVIDGIIEVGTTAEGRTPLRIPVVRSSLATAKG
jgi:hypothetical protein